MVADNKIPQPKAILRAAAASMRQSAMTDYVIDADSHSIRWHYERADKKYQETVAWRTFEEWAIIDEWARHRSDYWRKIEVRVREGYADAYLARRVEELEWFQQKFNAWVPFLDPLVDPKTGAPLIDSTTGLPKFGLEMPSLDKFLTVMLKWHERVMLLRGDVTSREEKVANSAMPAAVAEAQVRAGTIAPNVSRDDARAMAHALVMRRAALPRVVVDAVPDGDLDDGDSET